MIPKAAQSKDGRLRIWTSVEFPLEISQLADYFWHSSPGAETYMGVDGERPDVGAQEVHRRVRDTLYRRGADYFVEDDSEYEHGGREWAMEQVRRAYGFPQDADA